MCVIKSPPGDSNIHLHVEMVDAGNQKPYANGKGSIKIGRKMPNIGGSREWRYKLAIISLYGRERNKGVKIFSEL